VTGAKTLELLKLFLQSFRASLQQQHDSIIQTLKDIGLVPFIMKWIHRIMGKFYLQLSSHLPYPDENSITAYKLESLTSSEE
jgi:hypothetical protein